MTVLVLGSTWETVPSRRLASARPEPPFVSPPYRARRKEATALSKTAGTTLPAGMPVSGG
jgi:hypothetical protein